MKFELADFSFAFPLDAKLGGTPVCFYPPGGSVSSSQDGSVTSPLLEPRAQMIPISGIHAHKWVVSNCEPPQMCIISYVYIYIYAYTCVVEGTLFRLVRREPKGPPLLGSYLDTYPNRFLLVSVPTTPQKGVPLGKMGAAAWEPPTPKRFH